MRKFQIKIKTAQGTRFAQGIFPNKWTAVEAGMDMAGEGIEANVTAYEVPA